VCLLGLKLVSRKLTHIMHVDVLICNDIITQKPMNHVDIDIGNSIQLTEGSKKTTVDQMHSYLHIVVITQEEVYYSLSSTSLFNELFFLVAINCHLELRKYKLILASSLV
jgi:hypothetical protein